MTIFIFNNLNFLKNRIFKKYFNLFQQKLQIEGQCLAILNGSNSLTSGEMGLRDIYLLNRIMEAAENQSEVRLDNLYL